MNDRNLDGINTLIQQGYTVDIGAFIQKGWSIFKANLGGFIAFLIVTTVISFALGWLPVAGNLASIIIGGPLNAGNYFMAFKISKGQSTEFGDFFKGFQNSYFLSLFLATLVIAIFIVICFIPAIIAGGILGIFAETDQPDLSGLPALLILAFLGFIPAIYLSISYMFAIPLIVERKMAFWPAMETSRRLISKQWFGFFGFVIVLTLLNFAGALLCLIGLLLTAPLSVCAVAAAYEQIVGLSFFEPAQS